MQMARFGAPAQFIRPPLNGRFLKTFAKTRRNRRLDAGHAPQGSPGVRSRETASDRGSLDIARLYRAAQAPVAWRGVPGAVVTRPTPTALPKKNFRAKTAQTVTTDKTRCGSSRYSRRFGIGTRRLGGFGGSFRKPSAVGSGNQPKYRSLK
jgi:hypothetical protein